MTLTNRPDNIPNDPLVHATAVLREFPIAPFPADLLARAERLTSTTDPKKTPKLLGIAAALFLAAALLSLLLLDRATTRLAFADVVQSINQTYTFSADIHNTRSNNLEGRLLEKGRNRRIEFDNSIRIINGDTGKSLDLDPATHFASLHPSPDHMFDLYEIFHNYQTGKEVAVGQKTIDGRKTEGFRITRPDPWPGQPDRVYTLWIDPQTRLPVRIDTESGFFNNLHFDAPLSDTLFNTTPPTGYTLADLPSQSEIAWDHFKYAGQILDPRGQPIANVQVVASHRIITDLHPGFGTIDDVKTDRDGRFSIDCRVAMSGLDSAYLHDEPVRLEFRHPDFLYASLQDVHLLSPELRADLRIRLRNGYTITGTALDPSGKSLPGVLVQALFGKPDNADIRFDYRKAVLTDSAGRFELRGLAEGAATLLLSKPTPTDRPLFHHEDLSLPSDTKPLTITLQPLDLPAGTPIHELLGMKFVDLTDDLRTLLSLDKSESLLLLDPGPNQQRLGLDDLQQGDILTTIGNAHTPITSYHQFVQQLVTAAQEQNPGKISVKFRYDATRLDQIGYARAGSFHLTPSDLADLTNELDRPTPQPSR